MTENDDRNIVEFIKDLDKSKEYLEHNYNELKQLHLEYLGYNDYKNIDELRKILRAYCYALSNYLSSYCAVIDHMMKVKKTLNNEQITIQYQNKLDSGKNNEQKFAKDLRNYIDHYRLPLVDACVRVSGQPVGHGKILIGFENISIGKDYSPSLKLKELQKWGGWKKESRTYLNQIRPFNDILYVATLIEKLHLSILEFLVWFKTQVSNLKTD